MNTNGNNAVKYISDYKKPRKSYNRNNSYSTKADNYLNSKSDTNSVSKNTFGNIPKFNYDANEELQKLLHSYKSAEYMYINDNIFSNNSKLYEAYTGEEDLELDNNDKNNIRDTEQRIYQSECRINETEKRIYQNNKDLEARIDKNFDDIKSIFKDYKNDIKEEIKVHTEHNEGHIRRIEESITKLEERIDSTNKWIIGLCLTTIIGIATIAVTILISK